VSTSMPRPFSARLSAPGGGHRRVQREADVEHEHGAGQRGARLVPARHVEYHAELAALERERDVLEQRELGVDAGVEREPRQRLLHRVVAEREARVREVDRGEERAAARRRGVGDLASREELRVEVVEREADRSDVLTRQRPERTLSEVEGYEEAQGVGIVGVGCRADPERGRHVARRDVERRQDQVAERHVERVQREGRVAGRVGRPRLVQPHRRAQRLRRDGRPGDRERDRRVVEPEREERRAPEILRHLALPVRKRAEQFHEILQVDDVAVGRHRVELELEARDAEARRGRHVDLHLDLLLFEDVGNAAEAEHDVLDQRPRAGRRAGQRRVLARECHEDLLDRDRADRDPVLRLVGLEQLGLDPRGGGEHRLGAAAVGLRDGVLDQQDRALGRGVEGLGRARQESEEHVEHAAAGDADRPVEVEPGSGEPVRRARHGPLVCAREHELRAGRAGAVDERHVLERRAG
jgi:hypothetical protein